MNAKSIILIILVLVLILLGFGAQIFATRALNNVLNKRVIPEIKEQYGLDVSFKSAEVNLLKRRADLSGILVRNPIGFQNPTLLSIHHGRVAINLKSLIQRNPIIIDMIQLNGVEMDIERNKDRQVNVRDFSEIAAVQAPTENQTSPVAEQPTGTREFHRSAKKEAQPISLHFRRIEAEGAVIYTDRILRKKYQMNLELSAKNIFTAPEAGQLSTLITLRGGAADDPSRFATDLSVFMSPLTNLERPTFNATGSVENMDPALIEELLSKNDLNSGSFSVRPSIACKHGQLDGSSIGVALNDVEYNGTPIGSPILSIPVKGSLWALSLQSIDLTGALQSLLSDNAGSILKAVLQKNSKPKSRKLQDIKPTDKNTPADTPKEEKKTGDLLVDKLGSKVKEIDESEETKQLLRELGNSLFGD